MVDELSKGLGGAFVPSPNPDHPDKLPVPAEASHATPEDEAAATDPLGRSSDGPAAVNRDLPPGADHGGRDRGEDGQ
jgi:hypothetical protein